MEIRLKAVIVGSLVTLLLWAIAFTVLLGVYRGELGWLLAGLGAFLCPVVGGYVAARLAQSDSIRVGALAGLAAGLVVLLSAVVFSHMAPNMTLAGAVLVIVGAVGGGIGSLMRYSVVKAASALAVVFALVLIVTACGPTTAGSVETGTRAPTTHRIAATTTGAPTTAATSKPSTALPCKEKQVNPVEQAGLRDTVSLQVMAFDRYAVGSDLYVHRLTITDTQTVDLLIDALDADLFGGCVVECIPEHELHFHLKDGTVQTYGYSCGGASFLRGKQDFWQGVDYDPPERFDVLIQEQLALHPPAPVETSINLLDEAGLESAVGLEVSLLHTRSVSQGDTTVAEVSFEHLVTITDAVALGQLVDSLDTTLDLLPRTECVPEYVLRFKLGDGTLHDISYGCGDRDAPVLRGTLPFWRDMDLRPPVEFKRLFEEQLNRAAN